MKPLVAPETATNSLQRDHGVRGADNPGQTGCEGRGIIIHTGRISNEGCSRVICRSGGFDAVPPEEAPAGLTG